MKHKEPFILAPTDLRALVFWASVGVRLSESGSYSSVIEDVVNRYAKETGLNLGGHVEFKSSAPRAQRRSIERSNES